MDEDSLNVDETVKQLFTVSMLETAKLKWQVPNILFLRFLWVKKMEKFENPFYGAMSFTFNF